MPRHADWQIRLMQYLSEAARRPFAYGQHDCALFAADCVAAMTGLDIADDFRGRYRSATGGRRALRLAGYADHVALAAAHFAEIPVAMVVPGDIAVLPTDEGPALGIVQGEAVYVVARDGLAAWPLLTASRAFRVG